MSELTATVVITTKNRKEELLKAVRSALEQRGLAELIVIDDGSSDGTVEAVAEMLKHRNTKTLKEGKTTDVSDKHGLGNLENHEMARREEASGLPVLRVVRHAESKGYIVRRNEAARLATGDVIFSLDDDAVFSSPHVVEQTLGEFSHPRIGAVAIPCIEPQLNNKELQRAPAKDGIWVTANYKGTAHAVRRDVFLAVGGYRGELIHQGEEGDFCVRMLAADAARAVGKYESGKVGKWESEMEQGARSVEHGAGSGVEMLKEEKLKGERENAEEGEKMANGGWRMAEATGSRGPSDQGAAESSRRVAPQPTDKGPRAEKLKGEREQGARSVADGELRMANCGWRSERTKGPGDGGSSGTLEAAVPGFFVRMGNSDPIIHNESPRRDYSRMDFYGRRNDILFHWQNTPMPTLLWAIPSTIFGGMVCAAKTGRWSHMLKGIAAGLWISPRYRRRPLPRKVCRLFKLLKQSKGEKL